jgi:hypothetical protein
MEIRIDLLEASAELADLAVKREVCGREDIEEHTEDWDKIYEYVPSSMEDEDDIIVYTDKAQERFNVIYDYYFDMLDNLKIEE